jgi:hypothetical protein
MSKEETSERVQMLHECSAHKIVGDKDGNVRVINALQEGQALPPGTDMVTFEPVEDEPDQYDMKTIYKASSGPAKVATTQYRKGWDDIFAKDNAKNKKELN